MDKVLLLELGAHDYVTKPFSPRELLALVAYRDAPFDSRSHLGNLLVGEVKIDFSKMELYRNGTLVQLTAQEFKVLPVHDPERGARTLTRGVAESCVGLQELSEHGAQWITTF